MVLGFNFQRSEGIQTPTARYTSPVSAFKNPNLQSFPINQLRDEGLISLGAQHLKGLCI